MPHLGGAYLQHSFTSEKSYLTLHTKNPHGFMFNDNLPTLYAVCLIAERL